jgi:hypothetical protein
MEYLQSKFFDIEQVETQKQKVKIPHVEGIIVDKNHKISEDIKFGCQLAKDSEAWYRYFGL